MKIIKKIRLYKLPVKREFFLNRMAKRGWELINVSPSGFCYTFRECENRDFRYKVLFFPEDQKQKNLLLRSEAVNCDAEYIFRYGKSEFLRMKRTFLPEFMHYTAVEKQNEMLLSIVVAGACAAVLISNGRIGSPGLLGLWIIPKIMVYVALLVIAVRFIADACFLGLQRVS